MGVIITNQFNLRDTVLSGQIFRFEESGNDFRIFHRNQSFRINQENNKLKFEGSTRRFIKNFFRIDEDYSKILDSINKDEIMNKSINFSKGLHLINQDPWECAVSFLCSAAAPITKIQNNVFLLSEFFGKKNGDYFEFPKEGSLCDIKKIKEAKTGFRAKYILGCNKFIRKNPSFFKKLEKKKYYEARKELCKLPGIGEKIADCVLLFSLNFDNAFPIDTWIKKVMRKYYNEEKAHAFSQQYYG